MRNRGNVLNAADFDTCCLQCADSRFTACARSFDKYISGTHSLIDGCSRCLFCCHLRRKRRALTGTFESQSAGRCPGNGITVRISNRYNRIVECGTNMRCTGFYMFSFFSFCFSFYRSDFIPPSTLFLGRSLLACDRFSRSFAGTGVCFCTLSAGGQSVTMTAASVRTDFH